MTATTDFMNDCVSLKQPVRLTDGGRMIMRAAIRLMGAALTIAAVAIWIAPGATWESDVMLFKLVLSLTAILAGLGLLQSSRGPEVAPDVEIDSIRREVRLQRTARGCPPEVLERCTFADLSRAEVNGGHVRLYGADKGLLAEVSLRDRKALGSLLGGLEDAGKLV